MKINTALILCAGYGKRLNPLTLDKPKPLLKLNKITLLENTIKLIKNLGIKKIKLNTFYLKDQIKYYLENHQFNIDIEIIEDGNEILDTGGGILNMMNTSNEENFLIFNPDTHWSDDYLSSIENMEKYYFLKKIENILMVVNKKSSFDQTLKGDFNLSDYKLKKNNQRDFIYTGCQIISKNLFRKIEINNFSITTIWDDLIKKNQLFGYEDKNKFFHLTNFEIYQSLLKNK